MVTNRELEKVMRELSMCFGISIDECTSIIMKLIEHSKVPDNKRAELKRAMQKLISREMGE